MMRASRSMCQKAMAACIVHAAGPQRQGSMVLDVLDAVSKYGGDVHSSRATLLGPDLSMMLVVKCEQEKEAEMQQALKALDQVKVCFHEASAPDVVYSVPHRHRIRVLRMTGHDANGIVMHLSEYLTKKGIRILNIASEVASAPFTDDPMFKLRCVLDLPVDVPEDVLDEAVDTVSKLVGIDCWVESVE
eukprot:TRINITY_DN5914_c0_g1_i1.p1 TRINITY_DN5914_c0_g1~~TRINITY_DN5914_c0_g1_i1.p1  ORF type:complete len:189 (+),score=74.22 TRINITY_DN5914_c0_g1_i1:389-955(+)